MKLNVLVGTRRRNIRINLQQRPISLPGAMTPVTLSPMERL